MQGNNLKFSKKNLKRKNSLHRLYFQNCILLDHSVKSNLSMSIICFFEGASIGQKTALSKIYFNFSSFITPCAISLNLKWFDIHINNKLDN